MSYADDLKDVNWEVKRVHILHRDQYRCQRCNCARPIFRNIGKEFGVNSWQQLQDKGFRFDKENLELRSYDDLNLRQGTWFKQTIFIGDTTEPLDLERLRFVLRFDHDYFFAFGTQKNQRLIAFYPEKFSGEPEVDLNIHHLRYIEGRKPWDYNEEYLTTLCTACHTEVHATTVINVYSEAGGVLYATETCDRCAGAGYIPEYAYCQGGICFKCRGEGVLFQKDELL